MKKVDRSQMIFHAWINFPNNSNRKCTRCGVTRKLTRGKWIYCKDGVEYKEFINCVK